jgi:cyclase
MKLRTWIPALALIFVALPALPGVTFGHGPLSDRAGLQAYLRMLEDVRGRVQDGIDKGRALAQVQAARPTAQWDAAWGGGFLKPDAFVAIVYESLGGKP